MPSLPLSSAAFRSSVIAVPPLARNPDFSLNREENKRIVTHIEAGGVSILLYGGNAILYHIAPSEYGQLMQTLSDIASPQTLVIPSVGPAYGTMMDQAKILNEFDFATAMILPQKEISTSQGIARAIRDFCQVSQRPAVLYIKHDNYLDVADVVRLMSDGLLSAIKYAIVRDEPSHDHYLKALIEAIGSELIVSGMGEQPAIIHMRQFGLPGFTSGCVCIRPDLSTAMLQAVNQSEFAAAEQIREIFRPLEDLRNTISPIRVLHEAVTLADIAHTGPLLPCLSDLEPSERELVSQAANQLLQIRP
jgi:dihydrodipicolinate synthase/N-acetylneuraminate lyase